MVVIHKPINFIQRLYCHRKRRYRWGMKRGGGMVAARKEEKKTNINSVDTIVERETHGNVTRRECQHSTPPHIHFKFTHVCPKLNTNRLRLTSFCLISQLFLYFFFIFFSSSNASNCFAISRTQSKRSLSIVSMFCWTLLDCVLVRYIIPLNSTVSLEQSHRRLLSLPCAVSKI